MVARTETASLGIPPWSSVIYQINQNELGKPTEYDFDQLFEEVNSAKYSDNSQSVISYSGLISRSHDINDAKNKRLRKFDGTPYISHPISMAREAIRMRLHPTIISACLMHDVPEDVILTEHNLKGPDDWISYLSTNFEGYSDRDRLMRILRAELKTNTLSEKFKNETERKSVVDFYMHSPLGKVSTKYINELKPNQPVSDEDQESIAEVLFDLNRIMSDSFVKHDDGRIEFDPSILTVKILDTWDNLKTVGFWKDQLSESKKAPKTVAKLVRARILTNIAEFLGMRQVSSDMTMDLSIIQNTKNIDQPFLSQTVLGGGGEEFDRRLARQKTRMDDAQKIGRAVMTQIDKGGFNQREQLVPMPVMQMPWGDSTIDGNDDPLSQIVLYVPSDPKIPSHPKFTSAQGYEISEPPLGPRDGVFRPIIYSVIGRSTRDYKLTDGGHRYRLRFQDTSPRLISTLKAPEHNPAKISSVPERNIFHPDVCEYISNSSATNFAPEALSKVLNPNLTGLLSFMLSPRMFIEGESGPEDTPYIIFVNQKMYLASNQTDSTLYDIATQGGVTNPIVAPLRSEEWTKVGEDDHNVLNNLRHEGKLNKYHIVRVKEKVYNSVK